MAHPTDRLSDEACRLLARRAYDRLYVSFTEDGEAILDRDAPWDFDLHDAVRDTLRTYGGKDILPSRGHDDEDWDETKAQRVEAE